MCPRGSSLLYATYLHAGLPPMSKFVKGIPRSPTQRLGCVVSSAKKGCDAGTIWCTHLALGWPVPHQNTRQTTSATQADVALVVVAGVAGGDYIAKTGHCGFAYTNTARYLKTDVLNTVQVPQPYIVTNPIRNNITGLIKHI